jgi:hypothetical protein
MQVTLAAWTAVRGFKNGQVPTASLIGSLPNSRDCPTINGNDQCNHANY